MRYIQDGRIYLAGSEGEVPAGVNLDRDFVQLPAVEFEIVNIARGVVHVFKLDAMGKRRAFGDEATPRFFIKSHSLDSFNYEAIQLMAAIRFKIVEPQTNKILASSWDFNRVLKYEPHFPKCNVLIIAKKKGDDRNFELAQISYVESHACAALPGLEMSRRERGYGAGLSGPAFVVDIPEAIGKSGFLAIDENLEVSGSYVSRYFRDSKCLASYEESEDANEVFRKPLKPSKEKSDRNQKRVEKKTALQRIFHKLGGFFKK